MKRVQNTRKYKNSLITDRISIPPVNDRELELDVLYSLVMIVENAYKTARLSVDDFYHEDTREIFNALSEMYQATNTVDLSILPSKLKNLDCFLNITSRNILASQIDNHIQRLREITNLRKIQDIAFKATIAAREGKKFSEVKAWQINELENIRPAKEQSDSQISDIENRYDDYIQRKEQPIIKTGYPKLDWVISGFVNGSLNVIASAQGLGKTTLALNIVRHICSKLNKKVLYVSLEMTYLALYGKLISAISGISFSEVMAGRARLENDWTDFTSTQWAKVNDARAQVYEWQLYFCGEQETDTTEIASRVKEIGGVDIVFIDYLQLLRPQNPGGSIYETTSAISRELKMLAMKFDIPFVVINSINRDYASRSDFKPHISDLRNSGQLEYDADLVLLLHRPAAFREAKPGEKEIEFKHKSELIIAKNRLGEANIEIDFYFDGEKGLFREMLKSG